MADEKEEQTGEETQEPPKKKSKKMLIIIIVVAVAVLAGGTGAFFFFTKAKGKDKKEVAKTDEGVMFALDPFVVNLSDQTGSRFLKVSVQLELAGPTIEEKAKVKTPQMRDAIITLLTNKTSEALVSPEGKLQLKDEINVRGNQILGENSVKNVYLTDFVMQ